MLSVSDVPKYPYEPLNRHVPGHFPRVSLITEVTTFQCLSLPSCLCLTPSDPVVTSLTFAAARPVSRCLYLEAVFELLGDEVEDYGIDAGVDGRHVDAEVVEHQQETATTEEEAHRLRAKCSDALQRRRMTNISKVLVHVFLWMCGLLPPHFNSWQRCASWDL